MEETGGRSLRGPRGTVWKVPCGFRLRHPAGMVSSTGKPLSNSGLLISEGRPWPEPRSLGSPHSWSLTGLFWPWFWDLGSCLSCTGSQVSGLGQVAPSLSASTLLLPFSLRALLAARGPTKSQAAHGHPWAWAWPLVHWALFNQHFLLNLCPTNCT